MNLLLRILLLLNFLALVALGLAVAAQWINPQSVWLPAFLGIGFPIVAVVHVAFAMFWLLLRRRWWLMSAAALLISLIFLVRYFALRPFAASDFDAGYRILSYNVHNFDLYNWNHNSESRDSIIALIKRQQPDIVCFQEFYQDDGFVTADLLSRELKLPHHHFAKTLTLRGKDQWGIATFSRFPIIDSDFIPFEGTRLNGILRTDIELDSTIIRVFNVHLQSIRFRGDEFENMDADYVSSSRRIAGKVRYGFRKRAEQAQLLANAIDVSPHPVIVCGDFNDPPVSYTYRTIARGLKDAFMKKGFGIGTTYAGNLPGLRIDYILMDKRLRITGFKRIKRKISDHYPVMAGFGIDD